MKTRLTRIQRITFLIALLPILWFLTGYLFGRYEPYPVLFLTQFSGTYAVIFLLASLSCTPIRVLFSITAMNRARKSLGLTSFYYAALHAFSFLVLDYDLNISWLVPEFQSKPYLLLGLAAILSLLILAITSIKAIQSSMAKSWVKLHRVVYIITGMVLIHQYFAIKGDKREALIYMGVFMVLMFLRIPAIQHKLKFNTCKGCKNLNIWLAS